MNALGRAAVVFASILPTASGAETQQPPAPPTAWSQLPRMQLERQFAGPLQDTIIQRWRDPTDGSICYIYLPITAPHSPPAATGYVQYGANTIGSISCFAGPRAAPSGATAKSAR
jgi:hypothetical protein